MVNPIPLAMAFPGSRETLHSACPYGIPQIAVLCGSARVASSGPMAAAVALAQEPFLGD